MKKKVEKGLPSMLKHLSQLLNLRYKKKFKIPLFVVGCQRSGTTMILNVLSRSPQCRVYHEGHDSAYDQDYHLRSDEAIQRLIRKGRQQVVVFKPLNDAQHTCLLLGMHANAKAIWIYRRYQDVINSSIKKWSSGHKEIMLDVTKGVQNGVSEKMTPETMALVSKLCSEIMSSEDGAALHWYVRNLIYFELQNDPRVLLVKYEDLVTNPEHHFREIFSFIGCRYSPTYSADIFDSSVGSALSSINPEIMDLCDEMMDKLNIRYASRHV